MTIWSPLSPILIMRVRDHFCTSYVWDDLQISIVSVQQPAFEKPPELLLFQFHSSKLRRAEEFRDLITVAKKNAPIEVSKFRHKLSADLGLYLSRHLLEVQRTYMKKYESLIEETAHRYLDLIAWGEPNSAKVLAEYFQIPIRTVHSRLRVARQSQILESPGAGFRF